jgi:sigma-B regulation protein RsbU (phosphoserine phosphatase)
MRGLGLQRRFVLLILGLFAGVCLLAYPAWTHFTDGVIQRLGMSYTRRTVTWQTEKTEALIDREVTLARKLATSPLLQQWCRAEGQPGLTRQALAELESYRALFRDQSVFFIVDRSRHYYFGDAQQAGAGPQRNYTLDPQLPADRWYFTTMRTVADYALNVDHSVHLHTTKVWINVIVQAGGQKIGMAGTGIDLTDFLTTLLNTRDAAATAMLFDRRGVLTAHRDPRYLPSTVSGHAPATTSIYQLLATPADRARLQGMVAQALARPRTPVTGRLTLGETPYLAAVAYMPSIQWFDLVLINTDSLLGLRHFLPILGVMVCALLLLLVGTTLLVQHLVLRPLARLTVSTQAIASGHDAGQLPETRADEIGLLTRAFNRMSATVKDTTDNLERLVAARTGELEAAHAQLAEQHAHITDSITYATLIQRAVLPSSKLLDAYFPAQFALWLPRDRVGGDAYFAHEVSGGLVVALVDCTGHGVPGAMMTMTASALLQHHLADARYHDDPAALLRGLDRSLRGLLGQELRDQAVATGMEMGILCYRPAARRLLFAGARIGLWVAEGPALSELPGARQGLGYGPLPTDGTFANHLLPLTGPLTLYLTTDGWLDQSGPGSAGRGFGRQAFRRMLTAGCTEALSVQETTYLTTLRHFQGAEPQRDDITLIGFTVPATGDAPHTPLLAREIER